MSEDMPASAIRVAHFTGNYNYAIDGVCLTVNRLVAYLESRGVAVRVFAPTKRRRPPAVRHAGQLVPVPSVPVPLAPAYRLAVGLPPKARRSLAEFRPNLLHIHTPDLLGFAALRYARRHGIPAVATYHTHFSAYMKYYGLGLLEPLAWRVQRRFYNRCDAVYVAGESLRELLRAKGFTGNFTVWPLGVDRERFRPDKRSLEWRRSRGVPDDVPLITFVGRLVWEKSPDVFAAVLDRLTAAGIPHRGMVIGDGPARAALQSRMPDAIFTGYLTGAELAVAFASSDVFLYPSASETFGCVTTEALASGVPVVAADATGSRDIVRHGEEGFLCPPGDVEAFYRATLTLLKAPDLRERMREAALRRAAEFDWSAILRRALEHYGVVIRGS